MQFQTQLRRARLTYAVVMATCICFVMSAISTSILTDSVDGFLEHWPHVFLIDLLIAIPLNILLGPIIRQLCSRLYPDISK